MIRACPHCSQKNRIHAKNLADKGSCGRCGQTLPPLDAPIEVEPADFAEIIQHARVPVLVDFWAPWCGPCKMAAPELRKAAQALAGQAVVIKLDTEAHPALAAQYHIRSIPLFAVFTGGQLRRQHAGLIGQQQLQELVRAHD